MKKFIALLLVLTMVLCLAACGKKAETDIFAKGEGVMTAAEYQAADVDTAVTVETFVQAKQGWWEKDGVGVASFYTQDKDGGYFLYNMPCSQEDYNKLVPGTKIKVTGYKAEWAGEVEIIDSTFEILPGSYVAEAKDVTALLGTDDLIKEQNTFIAVKGLTVAPANDAGAPFLFNWDGSGAEGDDLYFYLTDGTNTYSFTVHGGSRGLPLLVRGLPAPCDGRHDQVNQMHLIRRAFARRIFFCTRGENSSCPVHIMIRANSFPGVKHMSIVKRGDIYYADLSPVVGSEQGGMRPVLIVQNDTGNRHSPTVIAAAITSRLDKAKLPTHITLASQSAGLNRESIILLEQIRTLDKSRLRERMGRLDEETMSAVDAALAVSFGLN